MRAATVAGRMTTVSRPMLLRCRAGMSPNLWVGAWLGLWFGAWLGGAAAWAQPTPSLVEWPTLAGDAARSGTRAVEVGAFGPPRWVLSQTDAGETIHFIGPAGVASSALPSARVYTGGVIGGAMHAIAVDAESGAIVWTAPLPPLVFESWSSPTIDAATGVVLYAAGSSVVALRLEDGTQAWRTDLLGPPVNVTPVVTGDLFGRNRAFVTDYGGFGGPSMLYCINVSPRSAGLNPFDPGEVVWSVVVGSSTGATPAYLGGVVYVCSTGLDGLGFGEIRAFDALADQAPDAMWTFANPAAAGFFGGVAVREAPNGVFLYAASYAFYGGIDSANLVKVDAATGTLVWSAPANRTESIPLVLGDGRIVLSGGIQGFGSVPLVQMFRDNGDHAVELWNTAESTWVDANQNGVPDIGEFLLIGGRTTQPVVTRPRSSWGLPGTAGPRLLVGASPTGSDGWGAYTDLFELDLSKLPGESGFIVQQSTAAGSSAAVLGRSVYSIGTGGLAAVGGGPPRADLNGDGRVDIDDLAEWEMSPSDVDRDGVVDEEDRGFLLFELRRNEARGLIGRGPGGGRR